MKLFKIEKQNIIAANETHLSKLTLLYEPSKPHTFGRDRSSSSLSCIPNQFRILCAHHGRMRYVCWGRFIAKPLLEWSANICDDEIWFRANRFDCLLGCSHQVARAWALQILFVSSPSPSPSHSRLADMSHGNFRGRGTHQEPASSLRKRRKIYNNDDRWFVIRFVMLWTHHIQSCAHRPALWHQSHIFIPSHVYCSCHCSHSQNILDFGLTKTPEAERVVGAVKMKWCDLRK